MMTFRNVHSLLVVTGIFFICQQSITAVYAQTTLVYSPAPALNPLKGLVPYARPASDRFPHSMEFNYLALSDLVVGENRYNWEPLEHLLDDIASRHKQAIFRVWIRGGGVYFWKPAIEPAKHPAASQRAEKPEKPEEPEEPE